MDPPLTSRYVNRQPKLWSCEVPDLETDGPTTAAFRRGSISEVITLFQVCLLRAEAVPDWQPLVKLSDDVLAMPMPRRLFASQTPLGYFRSDWLAVRGALLFRRGRHAEAITDLSEAAGQERQWAQYIGRVFLAFAHLRLGQEQEARHWLDKAIAPEPGAGFSWESLAIDLLRPAVAELQKELGSPNN